MVLIATNKPKLSETGLAMSKSIRITTKGGFRFKEPIDF